MANARISAARLALGAAIGAAALAVAGGQKARAYEYTGVFPGGDCAAMAEKIPPSKLWYGHFTGQREWGVNLNKIQTRTVSGCFTNKATCENWLYQWRSAYQYNFWADYCVLSNQPRPRRPYAG
ncbi:hypothetical protein G3A50_16145 [Ancylobacter pratisalsi]|uniref:Uncharacterized protein n=2 Tax=Ancylobacter pratisalsi TaxID=1745854 RepID=A0A6P1YS08_9HYPH|nr:hypothetical protein G3A50_16145 [Ancylobacter pratisalsi]